MRSDWPNSAPARGWTNGAHDSVRTESVAPPVLAVSQLLAGVRRSLGLEVAELAARIAASPTLIVAMEQGRFAELPPWPETARIVTHWIGLAGIDPRPALSELSGLLAQPAARPPAHGSAQMLPNGPAPSSARARPLATAPPSPAPPDDTDARIAAVARVLGNRNRGASGWAGSQAFSSDAAPPVMPASGEPAVTAGIDIRHRLARLAPSPRVAIERVRSFLKRDRAEHQTGDVALGRIPAWRFGVAGIALLVTLWAAAINTSVVAAAVSVLPAPAGRVVRSFSDFVAEYFAPVREGHRWIDVGDPRSRRADKLRITPRSD